MSLKELLQIIINKINNVFISDECINSIARILDVTYVDVYMHFDEGEFELKWSSLPSNMTWGELASSQLKDVNGKAHNLVADKDGYLCQHVPGTTNYQVLCASKQSASFAPRLSIDMKFSDYPYANNWFPPV